MMSESYRDVELDESMTLGDLPDDYPIWVTANRGGARDTCAHLTPNCRHLRAGDCSVHEKRPPMYHDDTSVCQSCLGNPPTNDGYDLSTFMTAKRAGESDD